MPASGSKCFPKSGKLTPHYDKNKKYIEISLSVVFIRSALTCHHFYALTLVRLVADFRHFFIGLLELVVKNKREK